ncbi:S-isoprenylcysteine methyltransferase-like protein [Candidatus Methylobacter favarea]|uniref:S-isoprenylcysteine methyltransferase-like protein n=1 Tax=Candidatus Methylobacter favarea TaxID=2707345 RepID=A0A8S0XIK2_9GAMM|nr:isoprenylcysteine carboxylmethyltransferase family protein [Candidatus Methylobacter favarea]CAA9890846.1 S-isoprenylcysteine methyltransferase-like protein [Candidatus Methylobacter favarea]
MTDLFIQWGNFLFHTRNVLFPAFVAVLLFIAPPVAINNVPGIYFMIIGIVMILLGQGLRILTIGLVYIVRGGQKRRIYADQLVTEGIFSHSRNPLYVGNILITMGFMFISGNLTGILAGSIGFMAIYRLIILSEEHFLRQKFADAYVAFCARVPRWIPRFKGLLATIRHYKFDWSTVAVKEYGTIMTSFMVPLGLIAWKLNLAHKLGDYQPLLIGLALLVMTAYAVVRYLKKTERLRSMR